jgi:hypothetical protein
MTNKQTTKDVVRNFILEKIYSTSRFDLAVLAEKYEIEDEFALVECFERETERINKFFCYPAYRND